MREYPPILKGSEQQQLTALRDYLVRMAKSLDAAEQSNVQISGAVNTQKKTNVPGSSGQSASADDVKNLATQLKALIIKTANDLNGDITSVETRVTNLDGEDGVIAKLGETYVANSVFGQYQQDVIQTITETAQSEIRDYDMTEKVTAVVGGDISALQEFAIKTSGRIQLGYIADPSAEGGYALGVAITQNLQVDETQQKTDVQGNVYYEIAANQTFGLYTSTGWQFWVNGIKRGWFTTEDGGEALHVESIAVDNRIILGGVEISASPATGFGIRKI